MRKTSFNRLYQVLMGVGVTAFCGCHLGKSDPGIADASTPTPNALAAGNEMQAQGGNPYEAAPVNYEQQSVPVNGVPTFGGSPPSWVAPSDSQIPPPPARPRWHFGNSTDSHAADCPCCQPSMSEQENPLSRPLEGLNPEGHTVQPVSYQEGSSVPVPCPPEFAVPAEQFDLSRWQDATGGMYTPPDEFIFDGGDDGLEVRIDRDWTVRGLDQEDTVGHFDTLSGRRMVAPSNRVPIYAPRFGSVRKVYGIAGSEASVAIGGVQSEMLARGAEEVSIPSTTLQQQQPLGQVGQTAASTYRERTRSAGLENEVASSQFDNRFNAFEDLAVIRYGAMDQDDGARLAEGIDAASSWGVVDAASDVIDNLQVDQLGTGLPAGETVGIEEDESRPRLRLVKVASRAEAQPGDIIEFSVRFDNVGNEPIGNVTILDHLSPRLEVIEGSAQCSVEADFFVTEQEGTSQIFRAEIVDPLPAGQGGIVRFKCLVR